MRTEQRAPLLVPSHFFLASWLCCFLVFQAPAFAQGFAQIQPGDIQTFSNPSNIDCRIDDGNPTAATSGFCDFSLSPDYYGSFQVSAEVAGIAAKVVTTGTAWSDFLVVPPTIGTSSVPVTISADFDWRGRLAIAGPTGTNAQAVFTLQLRDLETGFVVVSNTFHTKELQCGLFCIGESEEDTFATAADITAQVLRGRLYRAEVEVKVVADVKEGAGGCSAFYVEDGVTDRFIRIRSLTANVGFDLISAIREIGEFVFAIDDNIGTLLFKVGELMGELQGHDDRVSSSFLALSGELGTTKTDLEGRIDMVRDDLAIHDESLLLHDREVNEKLEDLQFGLAALQREISTTVERKKIHLQLISRNGDSFLLMASEAGVPVDVRFSQVKVAADDLHFLDHTTRTVIHRLDEGVYSLDIDLAPSVRNGKLFQLRVYNDHQGQYETHGFALFDVRSNRGLMIGQ